MRKSPTESRSYRSHNDIEESTMYLDYPPTKPFINDEYERPPYKPVSSYPEGNRKGMISQDIVLPLPFISAIKCSEMITSEHQ